jgi:hypothetical protein
VHYIKRFLTRKLKRKRFNQLIQIRSKFKKFSGLNKIDKDLIKYIKYKNGFYIELGANDGISQSNTLFLEKYKNWSGILIEPNP